MSGFLRLLSSSGAYEKSGLIGLAFLSIAGTIGWTALFYVLACTHSKWMSRYPNSSKPHENERYWCTRQVIGIMHAVLVSMLALPTLFERLFMAPSARFLIADELTFCSGSQDPGYSDEQYLNESVAMAGLAFTTFTISDLVVSSIHGLMTTDYLLHHLAFISAGCIIRGNCMLPFTSAILMSMEVSTPFLNYMQFIKNRGDEFTTLIQVNGILFMITFVIFRLILNTYGAIDLAINREYALRELPAWQAWFLIVAICLGAALQFFWFKPILKKFFEMKRALQAKQNHSPEEDVKGLLVQVDEERPLSKLEQYGLGA